MRGSLEAILLLLLLSRRILLPLSILAVFWLALMRPVCLIHRLLRQIDAMWSANTHARGSHVRVVDSLSVILLPRILLVLVLSVSRACIGSTSWNRPSLRIWVHP